MTVLDNSANQGTAHSRWAGYLSILSEITYYGKQVRFHSLWFNPMAMKYVMYNKQKSIALLLQGNVIGESNLISQCCEWVC